MYIVEGECEFNFWTGIGNGAQELAAINYCNSIPALTCKGSIFDLPSGGVISSISLMVIIVGPCCVEVTNSEGGCLKTSYPWLNSPELNEGGQVRREEEGTLQSTGSMLSRIAKQRTQVPQFLLY